jgi:prevent-host-death family protein
MVKKVSATKAKAQLSSLIAEAGYGGQRILIERRGKPAAALVSVADPERLEQGQPASERPVGALALVGAWREVGDDRLDALVTEVYASREADRGRAVELGA